MSGQHLIATQVVYSAAAWVCLCWTSVGRWSVQTQRALPMCLLCAHKCMCVLFHWLILTCPHFAYSHEPKFALYSRNMFFLSRLVLILILTCEFLECLPVLQESLEENRKCVCVAIYSTSLKEQQPSNSFLLSFLFSLSFHLNYTLMFCLIFFFLSFCHQCLLLPRCCRWTDAASSFPPRCSGGTRYPSSCPSDKHPEPWGGGVCRHHQ